MQKIMLSPISQNENSKGYNQLYLQNEGSDWVSIRVTQSGFTIVNGIPNPSNKSALMRLQKQHLPAFLQYCGVKVDADKNALSEPIATTLQGTLQVQESFEPFYYKANGEAQDPKRKGANGEIITIDGKPVYRHTIFIADVNAPDYLFGSIEVSTNESGKEVRTFVSGLVEEEEVANTPPAASPAEAFNNVPA